MSKNKLSFDCLESRELMSAMRFAGSMRTSKQASVMIGMPPMQPPPPTNKPSLSIIGGSPTSVGGSVGVSVTPNNAWAMEKIVYSASGAIGSQSFDTKKGDFTVWGGATHSYQTGVNNDLQSFFWNESPGIKTINVSVTYNDPAHTTLSNTISVNVKKPTVTEMKISGMKYHMGSTHPNETPPGTEFYGLTNLQYDEKPGITIASEVADAPSSGEYGIVQIVTKFDTTSSNSNFTISRKMPPGKLFLDKAENSSWVELNNKWDQFYSDASHAVLTNRYDTPGHFTNISFGIPTSSYATSMTMDYKFDTYLVWHPSGGIYVAVDHVSWSVYASANYNGPTTGPNVYNEYKKASNWTVTTNPNSDWSKIGDKTTKLLKWSDNTADGMPPYTQTQN